MEFDEALQGIPSLISDHHNDMLTALATKEEVRKALLLVHLEKTPGPDRMTALFFQ